MGIDGSDPFWPVAPAAAPYLRAGISPVTFEGLLGGCFLTTTAPAIFADFAALIVPGLQDCGIGARLLALSEDPDSWTGIRQAGRVPIYGFAGEPFSEAEEDPDEEEIRAAPPETDAKPRLVEIDWSRIVLQYGLLCEWEDSIAAWEDANGRTHREAIEALQARFTRALVLSPGRKPATRRVALTAALRRATLSALAYPDRFVTASEIDADRRGAAARFLSDAAGKQTDTISRRWRLAGEYLQEGYVTAALELLHDAVLRSLNLPDALFRALALPYDEPLTDLQLREIIYLARAGSRDFKVLAARRLAGERSDGAVRSTLRQLALHPDPLVRAAAERCAK